MNGLISRKVTELASKVQFDSGSACVDCSDGVEGWLGRQSLDLSVSSEHFSLSQSGDK